MNDAPSECSKVVSLRALVRALLIAPGCGLLGLSSCGGSDRAGVGNAKLPEGTHSEVLDHEDCSDSGHRAELLDTNGDGKPDIHRVFDKGSGKEVCRVVDLNHDGKPDLYEYFDASGAVRRREFCYDETGVVNAIEHYDGGKLARRELDTSGQHRIDTWDWFDPGVPMDAKTGKPKHPSRRERDTSGRGMVDQWWTWDGDRLTIAYDRTGDGKPDPEATIVLSGGDDAGAAPPPGSAAGPAVDAGSAVAAIAQEAGAPVASAVDGGKK